MRNYSVSSVYKTIPLKKTTLKKMNKRNVHNSLKKNTKILKVTLFSGGI